MNALPAIDDMDRLADALDSCADDPLAFVESAFTWGEGDLAGYDGPEPWQADVLGQIRDGLDPSQALRLAVASGHGIGKSALVAWIILWSMATCVDTMGVVTANTDNQLKTKTQPQLAKWHRLLLDDIRQMFKVTVTAIFSADPAHERTWRIDMVPWSEHNTEAFAGLHNQGKRLVLIFDEASKIADPIWEVAEGALTDENTEIIWAAFGNPTQNTGRFRQCFARYKHRWLTRQIDSRSVSLTNKEQIQEWVDDWGVDSDFVRVRVRGLFPKAGDLQFISGDLVEAATKVETPGFDKTQPIVLGVDAARFGEDQSVIYTRIGRDGRGFAPIKLRGVDTTELANRVASWAIERRADAICVDGGGVGGGVVDQLRRLNTGGAEVYDINFGGKANNSERGDSKGERYANKAAEMWGSMRAWLKAGGAIPDDPELADELTGREYGYVRDLEITLEKKTDMKRRGLSSPDIADSLALTFAVPVAPRDSGIQAQAQLVTDHFNY